MRRPLSKVLRASREALLVVLLPKPHAPDAVWAVRERPAHSGRKRSLPQAGTLDVAEAFDPVHLRIGELVVAHRTNLGDVGTEGTVRTRAPNADQYSVVEHNPVGATSCRRRRAFRACVIAGLCPHRLPPPQRSTRHDARAQPSRPGRPAWWLDSPDTRRSAAVNVTVKVDYLYAGGMQTPADHMKPPKIRRLRSPPRRRSDAGSVRHRRELAAPAAYE